MLTLLLCTLCTRPLSLPSAVTTKRTVLSDTLQSVDTPDMDCRVTKTMTDDTVRIDLRKIDTNAALSLSFDMRAKHLRSFAEGAPGSPECLYCTLTLRVLLSWTHIKLIAFPLQKEQI